MSRFSFCMAFLLLCSPLLQVFKARGTYEETRRHLLSIGKKGQDGEENLFWLFPKGDERIQDLATALQDENAEVRIGSQELLRYLGSEAAMRTLANWYASSCKLCPTSGPIPIPISEFDYRFIEANLVEPPQRGWGLFEARYIYALALDGSPRAQTTLHKVIEASVGFEENTIPRKVTRQVSTGRLQKILIGEKALPDLVLEHAFFISQEDRIYTTARLLAFNGPQDKALVEVHVNRGSLAEEWFHVVVKRIKEHWEFFSVTLARES